VWGTDGWTSEGVSDTHQVLMDHLDDGRQAVGGARRGGDDVVFGGVVEVVVAAHNNVEDAVGLDGRRNHHLLHALVRQLRLDRLRGQKLPRALHHHLWDGPRRA